MAGITKYLEQKMRSNEKQDAEIKNVGIQGTQNIIDSIKMAVR